jgi:hypothetical protein
MNTDPIPPDDIQPNEQPPREVITHLYAAYLPFIAEDGSDKKNYLTNGEGGLRLFKTEQAFREWLEPQMQPENYAKVVIHPIEAKLALPAELEPRENVLKNIGQPDHLAPLMTFDNLGVLNALELLHSYDRRMKADGKNKGRKKS